MITIADRQGILGTVELADGQLTGSTPAVQRLADQVLASEGSPQAAYDALALIDNGYVRAVPAAGVVSQAIGLAFNPMEPRDSHGEWTGGSGVLEKITEPITAAEARGNSRAVSHEEFQQLANQGRSQLSQLRASRSPVSGLDRNWQQVKTASYAEVQKPWGGATIDAHTGEPLASNADKYALSVKPQGLHTVSVPETASQAEFSTAMDRALAQFRGTLESQQHHLGVFHDDDNHRIDIDPVLVVSTPHEVETIGAYTHAIGGAYHFRSGDGYFPPHVGAAMSGTGETVHWEGPGQWRSAAEHVQPGLTVAQLLEIGPDGSLISEQAGSDGLISDQVEAARET
jgi:hypothetical protein